MASPNNDLLKALPRLLPWRGLPPKALISLGKLTWTTMWQTMMSQLAPRDAQGAYQRPQSQFRSRLETAEAGRYELYVGMSCPWAHRTLVVRALLGLEAAIAVHVVVPDPLQGGWVFPEPHRGWRSLKDLYQQAQPDYSGRCTVPVLWDSVSQTIVNNESAEIIEILNQAFTARGSGLDPGLDPELDLYPVALRDRIDALNQQIYHHVNNGVYRCGFAQTQAAYDEAVGGLFSTLDQLDAELAHQRYLVGNQLTLADVRLFTTLIRFDAAYYGLFKCNQRRIQDYAHLSGYVRDIYQMPGIQATCDIAAVKRDYYGNLFPLNPGGLIPVGPDLADLALPHGRGEMSAQLL
jgi:glutathionyl-hydroquinone reductase